MAISHRTKTPAMEHNALQFALLVLLACVVAYLPALSGGFLFDDFANIVNNPAVRAVDGSAFHWLTVALSSDSGLLRRPISMLSFGLDYWLFGMSPLAFKLTNVAIHLLNGVLIYQLARRIAPRLVANGLHAGFEAKALALIAMALWLLHPLNLSGVVYVVQRMNELAALFILLGLLAYAEGRVRMLRGDQGLVLAIAGILVFGVLAALSKENGALITAYALVVEACCFGFAAPQRTQQRVLKGFFWLTLALPVALFLAWLVFDPQWLASGYAGRHFTLYQRVLSEARILCDYLLWIFIPLPHWMGIYHDDIATSTGLLHPATTLAAIVFLLGLIFAAWRWRRRSPGFAFAVAWFLIGHSMESTILPLELVFDHRNYLPLAGLLIGLTCVAGPWLQLRFSSRVMLACFGTLALVFAGITLSRAHTWGDPLRLALISAAQHPQSSRAQYEAGRRIIFRGAAEHTERESERRATPYFERGLQLDPDDVFSLTALIKVRSNQGIRPTDSIINDLAQRIRRMKIIKINPILNLMTAAIQGGVQMTPTQMKTLATATLDNPDLNDSMRAMVLNNYGHYMFQIAGDKQTGLSLTLAAAAQDPANPLFQLNLTRLALAINRPLEASKHLHMAEQLDKSRMYSRTIDDLKQQLAALETGAR